MQTRIKFFLKKIRHIVLFFLRKNKIKSSLSYKSKIEIKFCRSKYKGQRVILPLIETAHYKFIQLLLVAKAMQIRGADVKVVVCDESIRACEIKSIKGKKIRDICWFCRFNLRNYLPLFQLEFISLNDLLINNQVEEIKYPPDLYRVAEDSVVRHYYGNVPADFKKTDIYFEYLNTAKKTYRAAFVADRIFKPTLILGYMMSYAEWEPWLLYFKSVQVPFKHIGSTQFNVHAQHFNWPELYFSNKRFLKYISTRDNLELDYFEMSQLKKFNSKRSCGDEVFKAFGIKNSENKKFIHELRIDPNVKNIFLFPSVVWDVGITDKGGLYESVIDWVIDTINILKDIDGIAVYVRCHPQEKVDSQSAISVEKLIGNHFSQLPKNVKIIPADIDISSYNLFKYIDVGVTFIGTIGIEMLQEGIPTICTGSAPYKFLDSVGSPESRSQYVEMLLGNGLPKIKKSEVDLFSYFYFIRTPIPWDLTEFSYIGDVLSPLQFDSLDFLSPGKNKLLDHICDCLVDDEISPENWPS